MALVCPKLRKGIDFMLKRFKNRNRFHITNEQRLQIQRELSCDMDTLLCHIINIYQQRAMADISNFQVAAAAVGFSGNIYIGVNLETPLSTLAHTVHAEQFVIVNAHKSKETGLNRFVVSDFPCGHCRQFLYELPEADKIIIDVPTRDLKLGLSDLLPHSFSGKSIRPDCPTLLGKEPYNNHISLISGERHKIFEHLEDAALDAANASFAPYSNCPSGVAIELRDGSVFSGSYIESCAFNPSISPILSSVINMITRGVDKKKIKEISHAVIVELEDAATSQSGSMKEVIHTMAPSASISTLFARHEREEDRIRRYLQYI